MTRRTRWILIAAATPVVLALLVLLCPLAIGIWLPDIWTGQERTLGTLTLTNGIKFRVVQSWNQDNNDYYATSAIQTNPDGTEYEMCLDWDDGATWSVPMSVDWGTKTVIVILCGNRPRHIRWELTEPWQGVYD